MHPVAKSLCVCAPLGKPSSPSCIQFFAILWTAGHQAPLSMKFPRQEYWSGLPFFPPGDLPKPGIEQHALCLLHWHGDSLPLSYQGSPKRSCVKQQMCWLPFVFSTLPCSNVFETFLVKELEVFWESWGWSREIPSIVCKTPLWSIMRDWPHQDTSQVY